MTHHFTRNDFSGDGTGWRATADGSVVVVSDGDPSHVVLSWDEYRRFAAKSGTLADLLAWPGTEDIDLDALIPPRTVEPFTDPFADERSCSTRMSCRR